MVEFPDKERGFVRVSFAVASSSPPLWVRVPVPNAPPLPTARMPVAARVTLPIVFALLSATKPAATWSAPAIVSEPEFSRSAAAWSAFYDQGIREFRAADRDSVRSEVRCDDSVPRARDVSGRPVRGDAPIAADGIVPIDNGHVFAPLALNRFSALGKSAPNPPRSLGASELLMPSKKKPTTAL
jgi:hypothetical protein